MVYFHPYFTYHIEATHCYNTGIHYVEETYPPYSIPRYTWDLNQHSIYPHDIDEASVRTGFCYSIKRHGIEEIHPFLDYQYGKYAEKEGKGEDPHAYLEYLISTIESFKEWHNNDYYKLKEIGKWIRSHKGFKNDFNLRLWNWLYLNPEFVLLYDKERKLINSVEKEPASEAETFAYPEEIDFYTVSDFKKRLEASGILSQKPTQLVLAMFYFYLIAADYVKPFVKGTKGNRIKQIVSIHGGSPNTLSQFFTVVTVKSNRISHSNCVNLEKVYKFLEPFPEAAELAKNDLTRAWTSN